jgi:uncharacterized repeat protein (TIGR01451 family)
MKMFVFLAALSAPATAIAADNVSLDSQVFVERTFTAADGRAKVIREAPKLVTPGEKILFELTYVNRGTNAADNFVVTNPIPPSIEFVSADTTGAAYSVDGHAFGPLAALKVKAADGALRAASASDVTAVRWQFAKPIAVGGTGKLQFHGVVR